jgi:hypothetical protein
MVVSISDSGASAKNGLPPMDRQPNRRQAGAVTRTERKSATPCLSPIGQRLLGRSRQASLNQGEPARSLDPFE